MSRWTLERDSESEVVPDSYQPTLPRSRTQFVSQGAEVSLRLPNLSGNLPDTLPPYHPPHNQPAAPFSADRRIKYGPEAVFWQDEHAVAIYDRYPKSAFHLLVLSKQCDLVEPCKLSQADLPALDKICTAANWIARVLGERERAVIKCGVHAEPSMVPLHIHVISQDFDSKWMKTKKHWNSFTSAFFCAGD